MANKATQAKETRTPISPEPIEELMDLETLARQQGAHPIHRFEDLLGDFWPEEESVDEFLAAREEWRTEGDRGLS